MSSSRRAITALLICAIAVVAQAAPQRHAPVWETVSDASTADSATDAVRQQSPVDIAVRDGNVYITTDIPVKVEIFTILGQLVASRTVVAGVTRLNPGQRGVYILKAAGTTKRINI